MESYPNWPNLAAMMFGLARSWPEKPMLRAFRRRRVAEHHLGRLRAHGGLGGAPLAGGGRLGWGPRGDRQREPARIPDRRDGADGDPRRAGAGLYDQHRRRPCAHPAGQRRPGGDRLLRRACRPLAGGGELARGARPARRDGRPPEGPRGRAPCIVQWAELVSGDERPPDDIALEAAGIPRGALACLIYTSGTGGAPKGVMLPHRSILSNCRGAFEPVTAAAAPGRGLSLLPAALARLRAYGGQFFLLSLGTEVVYARGIENLASDLLTVQPTIMTWCRESWKRSGREFWRRWTREPPWRRDLFELAMAIGLRRLDGELKLADRLLDPCWTARCVAGCGRGSAGRFRAAMSGGARLEPEIGRFFLAMGIQIMQGYGQTEAGPVVSANPPRRDPHRHASAGRCDGRGDADRRRRRNPGARRPA